MKVAQDEDRQAQGRQQPVVQSVKRQPHSLQTQIPLEALPYHYNQQMQLE